MASFPWLILPPRSKFLAHSPLAFPPHRLIPHLIAYSPIGFSSHWLIPPLTRLLFRLILYLIYLILNCLIYAHFYQYFQHISIIYIVASALAVGRSRYPYGAPSLDGNRRGGDKNRSHRPGRHPACEDLSLCGSVFGTAFWTSPAPNSR